MNDLARSNIIRDEVCARVERRSQCFADRRNNSQGKELEGCYALWDFNAFVLVNSLRLIHSFYLAISLVFSLQLFILFLSEVSLFHVYFLCEIPLCLLARSFVIGVFHSAEGVTLSKSYFKLR